jgi:hypothetical protein
MPLNAALPSRIEDVEFFLRDKLQKRFVFRSKTPPYDPIDVSLSNFTAIAYADNQSDIEQPELDSSDAMLGAIILSWTADQVELLPRFFTVEIAEKAGTEDIEDATWDQLGEESWDDSDDEVRWETTALWDRTIIIGRFVRNDRGR